LETKSYSLLAAFPAGIAKGWNALYVNIKALGQLVSGSGRVKASESLGGFISISKLFPSTWEWDRFWAITAFLSLLLGFMNLLPIPALDGGHAVFLLLEIIMRRPVPQKVLEYAQIVGFVLLIGLLLFANGLDVIRWFKGG
jgi:regulator of sigma E protease